MARVIKLAQPGHDVKTAGDENLIYSSGWPLLPIVKQGSFSIDNVTKDYTIAEHNLGYFPAFWFFANSPTTAWSNGAIGTQERSEFFGPIGLSTIKINENKL